MCSGITLAYPVAILLKDWNRRFYIRGKLDIERLEGVLEQHKEILYGFYNRSIVSYSRTGDSNTVCELFNTVLEATSIRAKTKKSQSKRYRSPVAVAKALHVLAPNFFPPWDGDIARKYGCKWHTPADEQSGKKYLNFMDEMKRIIVKHKRKRLTLRTLDKYNYSHFTRGWV